MESTQDATVPDLVRRGDDAGSSKAHAVMERMKGETIDDLSEDPEVEAGTWKQLGEPRTAIIAPLVVKGRGVGALAVYERVGVPVSLNLRAPLR